MHNEAIKKLEAIKPHIGSSQVFEVLKSPKRAVEVNIPFKKKGTVIKAHRVQYNDALGPAKGGIRFHQDASLEETKALAFWMTIKNSLMGLPYGGGKGSVVINPKEFSEEELEELSREFVRQMKNDIGPDLDIPAPDVYTNPQVMAWMMDEYNKISGSSNRGVVTGKPLILGGSKGRDYATSQGAFYVLREALEQYGFHHTGLLVAVHGFGNAGQHISRILEREGHRIVSVADSKGAVYNEAGLDIEKLINHKNKTGTLEGFAEGITHEELLKLDVDVLALAALSNTLTADNAFDVKSSLILELANGPVDNAAEQMLLKEGTIILPDILSNAGGVTVSYFEWVQNRIGEMWDEQTVLDKLYNKMTETFYKVHKHEKENDLDLRTACYLESVKRIQEAEALRGRISN